MVEVEEIEKGEKSMEILGIPRSDISIVNRLADNLRDGGAGRTPMGPTRL